LDVCAPRGSFTLKPGDNPVVLLSSGIGVTPVISMLHALAAERSARQVWWIYGARNRANHPFVEESHSLLEQLPYGCLVSIPVIDEIDPGSVAERIEEFIARLALPRR
jgi:ferredoxin-NADP reductase